MKWKKGRYAFSFNRYGYIVVVRMVSHLVGGSRMKTRLMILLLISLLLTPPLSTHVPASGSEPSGIKISLPPPTKVLSSNVTGGLYNGLITYEDVVLIVNDNSAMSREIGSYFAIKRGLPQINIINISVPEKEIITETEYDELARQVRENLSARGLTDSINYMVTTKGVPLKVTSGETNMNYQLYYESASVDSELMLLDSPLEYGVHGLWWEDNPYAGSNTPFSREEYGIRLVTRLTGYTKEEAMALVDRAESSFGVRGNALLDMDPTKNGSGNYRQGNEWMAQAHQWLIGNDHVSYLETTREFFSEWEDTMAYYSWGSNDGDWGEGQMTNGGFESGTGPQASGWTYEEAGGIAVRSSESTSSGSWALKLERTGSGVLRAYQDIDVLYLDHRYILDGRMSPSGVTSPGARIVIEGYDGSMNLLWTHTLANRTGSRNFDSYQDPIENHTEVARLRLIMELLGDGVVYFDGLNLRVIRPHNQWLNGSIAETIVSTGGRSMTYGTWYGQSLVADIIRDGATGIKGYTWEPFLTAVSRAQILIPAYYFGYGLAESFWMGSPYVSWMGTVIGDPKCTPFINERPDMGPAIDEETIWTWVDEDGNPGVTVAIYNKGNRSVDQGLITFFMEGEAKFHSEIIDIPVGGKVEINLSSKDHPIIGKHTFTILLDPENKVWEYDEKNNMIEAYLEVNAVPQLHVELPSTRVVRTEPFSIMVSIEDQDSDISPGNLEFQMIGPTGSGYTPFLNWTNGNSTMFEAEYLFIPPWNASIGFYSLKVRYTDPGGSFDNIDLGPSIRVVNAEPKVIAQLFPGTVERGGEVIMNVTWTDQDTPTGALDIEVHAERSPGGKMYPIGTVQTSNWTVTCRFIIPPEDPSNTWTFTAAVTDLNGGKASWSGYLRSFNRPPTLEVINGTGVMVTRLDSAKFVVLYRDPEGLPSGTILARAFGPEGSRSANFVFTTELHMESDRAIELIVPASGLPLGNYSLIFTYKDDEGGGGELVVGSAFSVENIIPVIESLYISYPHGEGVYGETFLRSRSVTLTINVIDQDSTGTSPLVKAIISSRSGTLEQELFFDLRGEDTFVVKVSTDSSWPLGNYGMEVSVRDPDGGSISLPVPLLFVLDAEVPFLQSGELFLDLKMNASLEVTFGKGPGATSPGSVEVYLFSETGDLVASCPLVDRNGAGLWSAVVPVDEAPGSGNLMMIDDNGRTVWFNDSLSIEVEEAPPERRDGPEDDSNSVLLIMLAVLAVILLLAVVLMTFIMLRRRSEEVLVPAPPPFIGIEPQHVSTLGPAALEALPPRSKGEERLKPVPAPVPSLPPGTTLEDGSLYHKPDQRSSQPDSRSPVKALIEPVSPGEGDNAARPTFPKDPRGGGPSAELSNTPSGVAPPDPYVRDTHDTNIDRDPGQGQPQGPEGSGR
ncbi:MAG: TIGR03790 family protein [Candidatus Thermoplasmatota archaeon]|nr:TIGR03790 family protein [Candidatus Thermoplasmatota archaeon]